MLEIRYVQPEDKGFWYRLDKHSTIRSVKKEAMYCWRITFPLAAPLQSFLG